MMTKILCITLAVFIALFIPAGVFGAEKSGPVDFTLEPILSSKWICYIHDGDLYIRSLGNSPVKVRDSKVADAAILSPDIKVAGSSVFVTWIERGSDGNKVLFAAFNDKDKAQGKAVELVHKTKATRIKVLPSEEGRLFVLEFFSGKDPELFINLSFDNGMTFKRIQLETEGMESLNLQSPVVTDNSLYMFFWGIKEGKKYFGVKSYEIPSMKVKDSALLKETGSISFVEAFRVKDKPAAVYKTMREDKFILEGVVKGSADYETFSIKGAEGLDVARMDSYVWEDGRILIVFSGEEKEKFKQRSYAAVSEDGGRNWDVRRLDNKEFDNTRSWLPRIAVDGDKVAVVWEDSRDIRSGVRMKLSPDRGKTWKETDIPLSGIKNFAFRPKISFSDKAFYIAWHRFIDDEKKTADIVLTKLRWDDAVKTASKKERGISIKKKETLLKERVSAYWKGMMKKDMKTTYMIHDPFYRAKIPFDYYASRKVPMVYHAYSIEGLRIEGNIATVKLKIKYDVPKIMILGKDTSIPVKEITAEDIYLFVDGTWYRKFVDAMSGGSAIDY